MVQVSFFYGLVAFLLMSHYFLSDGDSLPGDLWGQNPPAL